MGLLLAKWRRAPGGTWKERGRVNMEEVRGHSCWTTARPSYELASADSRCTAANCGNSCSSRRQIQ